MHFLRREGVRNAGRKTAPAAPACLSHTGKSVRRRDGARQWFSPSLAETDERQAEPASDAAFACVPHAPD
jgi:hypothetical protein